MAFSMLKIRRPLGRLIFNMGIAIPGKTVFLIETAPRLQVTDLLGMQNENFYWAGRFICFLKWHDFFVDW